MAGVLIIGATSGIARQVASILAQRGDRLFLMARNADHLGVVASELGDAVAGTLSGDFGQVEANEARIEEAHQCLGVIDLALIAHGDLGDQLESERSYREADRLFRVNCMSVISLLIPLGQRIEEQGTGSIAVMSSVAADRGRPRNYTYAAAKSAVNVYLQGMRSRLWKSGGRVHILKLGPTHTAMTIDHPKNALFAEPDAVARGIVRNIDRGVSEAYVPGYWMPIMFVVRHLPESIFQRIPSLSGR